MSLRSVVKSEVKWSNSEEYDKSKKKHRRTERDDSSDKQSRSRERSDAKESPEKMKRKHSEERSGSEESNEDRTRDSARTVQKRSRRASYESDERHSSRDRRKDANKKRQGDAPDKEKIRNDESHEDSQGKDLDRRNYDERSKQRDDDSSRRDYDRDGKRSQREDRSRQRDERSHRDGRRSRQEDDRSSKDDERSRRDDDRPRQDDERSRRIRNGDRSRQDDDRSRRDDERSRRQDDERSRRDDDRPRQDGTRSGRDDDRQKRESKSSRPERKDEKSIDASDSKDTNQGNDAENSLAVKRSKPPADGDLMTRTGGAYIPPARLRMMQAQITDKASAPYQRIAWEALKKSINGLINKVNVSNIGMIVLELLQENIVRGRGLLARSIMQAQAASPTFTHVYAALVAIINTKFPNIGELIVKRLVVGFKKGFRRNEKATCLSSLRFIAHLFNQLVCHEVLALQVLMLLVSQPTDDSVEVAVGFLKECGKKLKELSPKSLNAVFESLRTVLHEATIDKRVQYMIEVMFAIRKDGFKDHPSVIKELDLVEEEDQYTHVLKLDDPDLDPEDGLNVFKFDPQYLENEEKYKAIKREHLDEGDSDEDDAEEDNESGEDADEDADDDDDEDGGDGEGKEKMLIIDNTETNLVAFRRTLYLTIQSSLDFEECAHKIRKMEIKPGQEEELCNMILDCCAQQRTYEKFFGLLAQRFCMMEKKFLEPFQKIFQEQYDTVHRLETNKLRNLAKFFAHLLHTDAINWKVLECIRLNEDDTTSSGRIFIKILFQELSEFMGLSKLNDRLKDATLQQYFEGLFPRDNPRNTRFAINFFTSIGLGGLTDELRDHLKSAPKRPIKSPTPVESSSSESSEDESDSSSSKSSSSSASDSSPAKRRRGAKPSETPEKSHKSRDGGKSKRSQDFKKSLTPAKSASKSEGPTSMQLRLMKLASYGQVPEDKDCEREKERVRGRDLKCDEDTRGRDKGRETHEDREGHRRGHGSGGENEREKEERKRLDEDKRRKYEESEKGHKDKRKREEDSESDRGRKRRSTKRSEDSASDSDREHKGRRSSNEGRGRERRRDKSRERPRRRSRS